MSSVSGGTSWCCSVSADRVSTDMSSRSNSIVSTTMTNRSNSITSNTMSVVVDDTVVTSSDSNSITDKTASVMFLVEVAQSVAGVGAEVAALQLEGFVGYFAKGVEVPKEEYRLSEDI